jgi:hypothetical protein
MAMTPTQDEDKLGLIGAISFPDWEVEGFKARKEGR